MEESRTIQDQKFPTIPKVHTTEFGGVKYDVRKLEAAAASLPVQNFDLSNKIVLAPILEGKYWRDTEGNSIGPADIITAFEENDRDLDRVLEVHPVWSEHIGKIRQVNYRTPLIVHKGQIIDGIHRLTKAVCEDAKTIPYREFDSLPSDTVYKE